ncbi:MAG: hypothetical protein EB112_02825 [Actinobacteria bacterium]|nr:hypothetical protein [Actinomycetota bacterium]NDG09618.1 hypothetical protein [Actinomycetota bacterium]
MYWGAELAPFATTSGAANTTEPVKATSLNLNLFIFPDPFPSAIRWRYPTSEEQNSSGGQV